MAKQNWFEVDKEGLAKIVAKRGKAFIVFELFQNAWDQNITEAICNFQMIKNKQLAKITIIDDDPDGFKDLEDTFTLFAESYKKSDPTKRGRFNIGEKLVLALCTKAKIVSTKGGVEFLETGERKNLKMRREEGSVFDALIKMTRQEYQEVVEAVKKLIPPEGIYSLFNGEELKRPELLTSFQVSLPTEISDKEGNLKRTTRTTTVEVFEAKEKGWIYEMGIPVVETDDKFDINIQQKVPLNMDRDNVTPSYLRTIRTEVLNHTINLLNEDDISTTWVKEAASDKRCKDEVIKKTMGLKFGEKRVIFDPSDEEANKIAVSKGYTVIPGRSLSKEEWENVRRAKAALPSGQVTPSGKIRTGPDGVPPIEWSRLTEKQKEVMRFTKKLSQKILGIDISVNIIKAPKIPYIAMYGGKDFTYNLSRIGKVFFEDFPNNMEKFLRIWIHELAHEFSNDHLSEKFYKAQSKLGAKLIMLALIDPDFFPVDFALSAIDKMFPI